MKRKLVRNAVFLLLGVLVILASGCTGNSDSEEAPAQEEPVQKTTNEEITTETENETPAGEEVVVDEASDGEYDPEIDSANFVDVIDNPYLPMEPGTTFVYEGESDGETIDVEIYVTDQTREVMGVTTTVIREREWEDGELVEDTLDWFAQDKDGNVWYFGEDSKEYEDGEVVSTAGSWEAGVDGAKPGIIMLAAPQKGDTYRQEYYEGEAEDMAEVLSLDASVTVPYGSFDNSLQTKEWTPLEPGVEENKYYASGVGLLLEEAVEGEDGRLELVEITTE